MLNQSGGIEADITVTCLKENYFRLICPAFARNYNKSHILKNINQDIIFKDVTDRFSCIGIFGPNSRYFLTKLFGDYFSKEQFPFARGKYLNNFKTKIWFQRLSFVGELGWEIYVPVKKIKRII